MRYCHRFLKKYVDNLIRLHYDKNFRMYFNVRDEPDRASPLLPFDQPDPDFSRDDVDDPCLGVRALARGISSAHRPSWETHHVRHTDLRPPPGRHRPGRRKPLPPWQRTRFYPDEIRARLPAAGGGAVVRLVACSAGFGTAAMICSRSQRWAGSYSRRPCQIV